MKKFALMLLGITFFGGCTHDVSLISRDNSGNGIGFADTSGKEVTIKLHGKIFKGKYVYDGGEVVVSSGQATSTAYGNNTSYQIYTSGNSYTHVPGSGKGKVFAMSGNDSIRCDFDYKHGSGIGYCQDNSGKEYDLLIE